GDELMARDCTVTDRISYGEMLMQAGVEIITGLQVTEIADGRVVAADRKKGRHSFEADSIVVALGYVPNRDGLADALRNDVTIDLYEIGDCVRTGRVYDAIHAGYRLGCRL
ncbi:MAG TPA: NADH oxidase, partial [Azoarcus taiwanensis]|nr:NADH oxidase [Azoarcus taiwanensis]